MLLRFDPFADGAAIVALFYVSFALAFFGSAVWVALCAHRARTGMVPSKAQVGKILRQTFLIVVFVVAVFALAASRLLKWWNIMPLALAVMCIEFFLRSLNRGVPSARR